MKKNKKAVKYLKEYIRTLAYFIVGLCSITKRLIKWILRNTILLIAGTYGTLYIIIPNLVSKMARKTPKIINTTIIYLLVFGACMSIILGNSVVRANTINFLNKNLLASDRKTIDLLLLKNTTLKEQNESYIELKKELDRIKYEYQKLRTIQSLNEIEKSIYDKAINSGLTHEQSILLVAISRHETGNWTSSAYNDRNNWGGIYCSYGIKIYMNKEEGLNAFVNLLKFNYFGQGLDTIKKIGDIYCPVGASNDPKNTNKNWIPRVTEYYEEYMTK